MGANNDCTPLLYFKFLSQFHSQLPMLYENIESHSLKAYPFLPKHYKRYLSEGKGKSGQVTKKDVPIMMSIC